MSTIATSTSPARLWRSELRACFALSWPLMLTNATEMALNITSTAMIGRISPEALAAQMARPENVAMIRSTNRDATPADLLALSHAVLSLA